MYNLIERECPFCNSTDDLMYQYNGNQDVAVHCLNALEGGLK